MKPTCTTITPNPRANTSAFEKILKVIPNPSPSTLPKLTCFAVSGLMLPCLRFWREEEGKDQVWFAPAGECGWLNWQWMRDGEKRKGEDGWLRARGREMPRPRPTPRRGMEEERSGRFRRGRKADIVCGKFFFEMLFTLGF